jgi:hypothetical protein
MCLSHWLLIGVLRVALTCARITNLSSGKRKIVKAFHNKIGVLLKLQEYTFKLIHLYIEQGLMYL